VKYLAPILVVVGLIFSSLPAAPHDPDHGENDPWYSSLERPDYPGQSCCGVADGYWCDDVSVRAGKVYCKITDTRDDATRGNRLHRPVGTEFEIPPEKMHKGHGNPTGHRILFIPSWGTVWCFVDNGGV
jgi:hypothetical protein